VFSEAQIADRLHVGARKALGDLFVEKYQTGDALKEYRLALEIRPNHPDLVFGIARAYFDREQSFNARRELERALEIRPVHADSMARMARAELEDRRFDVGREWIDRALEANPNHKVALALRATWEYLRNRPEGYAEYEKKALAVDPGYAGFYLTVAQVLGGIYRFADGLPFARKAIEVDPKLWAAYDVAGHYAFNLGRHEEGLEYLTTAQKSDNFAQPWRLNMIEVASIFDEFVERESEHFKIYIHVEENEVLRVYLEDLLEEAYRDMTRRYEVVPVAPTIIEVFPDADDFAVRNIGQVGIDLILGICFGRVFTMNSPNAKPEGFFSWAQTAWHEFAHVITLQVTRARIPRWLTEGISVYEERRAQPIWERRQERDLLDAYHNDKIFPLAELNSAFRTPRIGFAYYQGSLLVEFIENAYGFDAVLEILRLYAKDMTTEAILLEVLQLGPEEFDRRFLEWVGEKVGRFRLLPRWDRDSLERFRRKADEDPDDAENWARLAWAYYYRGGSVDCEAALGRALEIDETLPLADLLRGTLHYDDDRFERAERYLQRGLDGGAEDAFARLRLAQIYERTGRVDEALREYKRSKRAFPYYLGPGNPYARLEAIYVSKGDAEAAMREVRARAELDNTDVEGRWRLFAWYRDQGDAPRARAMLEELLWVIPFDLELHVELAALYRDAGRREEESRELEVAVALCEDALRQAELLRLLAAAEAELGRTDDARFHLEEALRLAPEDEEARRALEKLSTP